MPEDDEPMDGEHDEKPEEDGEAEGGASIHGLGGLDPSALILIVVGAHLRAEVGDRPIAYALRQRMIEWLDVHPEGKRPEIVVCSDVWYLNNDRLRECPTVSVGGPGVNALAAYLADKLPHALVVDNVLLIQMDVEMASRLVSVWGMDNESTVAAADAFSTKYLGLFMEAATAPSE